MVDSSLEERLKKRREADRRRREAKTPEKRCACLDKQKEYRLKRKMSETEEQRAARLAQLSDRQQRRLSSETEEQRTVRLAQLSHSYCHRKQRKKDSIDSNITHNHINGEDHLMLLFHYMINLLFSQKLNSITPSWPTSKY